MSRTATTLDLVGAVEVKNILGLPDLGRVTRWRRAGRLPPPYAHPKCSPVWVREDIERFRTGATDGFTPPAEDGAVLGLFEAAALLKVDKSQIGRWRRSPPRSGPRFPETTWEVAAGPLWDRQAIIDFAEARRTT